MNGKPLLTWDDFSAGLWLHGARDSNPPNTLRRAKGLHPVRNKGLRTRSGHGVIASDLVTDIANHYINAITYFAGSYWVGTTEGNLWRVTANIPTIIKQGFDGTPLRFLIMPPAGGLKDWLFISGGGTGVGLIKVDENGTVKPWGIQAPPDGFRVAALDPRTKTITTFTEFVNPPGQQNFPESTVWTPVVIPRGGEVILATPLATEPGYDPAALKATSRPNRLAWLRRKLLAPVDLTTFAGSAFDFFPGSSDLDYICLRVWVDLPNFIDFMEIGLDLGEGADANNYTTDFYTALITVKPKTSLTTTQANIKPLSELLTERVRELKLGSETVTTRRVAVRRSKGEAEILPFFAPTQVELAAQAWSDIRIPKANFFRSGVDETKDFSNITALALYFHTRGTDPETGQKLADNDTITVYFKDFRLEGGYGTKGPTYFHQITFRDSETGNRSNPNATPVATPQATTGKPTDSIDRNPFLVTKLPITNIPEGVDELEIWRTLGDGSDLFLEKREKISDLEIARPDLGLAARESFDGTPDIYDFNRREPITAEGLVVTQVGDNTLVTFTDAGQGSIIQVGDQLVVDGENYNVVGKLFGNVAKLDRTTAFGGGLAFEWLGNVTELGFLDPIALPLDNLPPEREFEDVTALGGRTYWLSRKDGQRGRVFFSPVGRPESLDDFREVANDQEETQRIVRWNGSVWVFTQARIYQVESEADPIMLREVAGSPGTTQPDTVVATRLGLFYQAADGIHIFDGTDSRSVDEPLQEVFQGEAAEGVAAFEGTFATQNEQEYFITDGTTTLAFDLERQRWRELGSAFGGLAYVPELQITVGGLGATLVEVEQEGAVTDPADAAIPFSWELPSAQVANGERALVRRVALDLNTQGERVTPTLVIDNVEVELPPIATAERGVVELAVSREVERLGVRVAGSVRKRVDVYDVEVDGRVLGGVG